MSDPITPTLPDPQATVDAALGNAPIKDETPLAFAAPTLNALPPTPPTIPPQTPMPEPAPSTESSYLPPVPPAPLNNPEPELQPKKKSKIMLVVLGIFGLFGVLSAGGYYVYTQMAKTGQIAYTGPGYDFSETECPKHCDGGKELEWKGQYGCRMSIRACNGGSTNPPAGAPRKTCTGGVCSCEPSNSYAYCGGCVDSCIPFSDLVNGGCNAYVSKHCGTPINLGGAKCTTDSAVAAANKWTKFCNGSPAIDNNGYDNTSCGGTNYYFSIGGYCNKDSNGTAVGLCATAPGCVDNSTPSNPDPTRKYTCDANGCSILGANYNTSGNSQSCYVLRYSCPDINKDYSKGCMENKEGPAKSFTFNKTCGVQQIDVVCPNSVDNFVSRKNTTSCGLASSNPSAPPSAPPSTPPNTPVIACTGLTQTPATTPVIGNTVTFTCAGTITPATAGTLSYKFRYSIDGGADQLLTNKTTTTAELTISACGTYSVQCKACATISGVLTCDPIWTGAVQ